MNIGMKIKEKRKAAGLTQSKLAELSGVATITIRQYETGKRQPRIEQLEKIANALGISAFELMEIDLSQAYAAMKPVQEQIKRQIESIASAIKENPKAFDNIAQTELLKCFNLLSVKGKKEAIKRIHELSMIPEYRKSREDTYQGGVPDADDSETR